jgi:hypothetical protein
MVFPPKSVIIKSKNQIISYKIKKRVRLARRRLRTPSWFFGGFSRFFKKRARYNVRHPVGATFRDLKESFIEEDEEWDTEKWGREKWSLAKPILKEHLEWENVQSFVGLIDQTFTASEDHDTLERYNKYTKHDFIPNKLFNGGVIDGLAVDPIIDEDISYLKENSLLYDSKVFTEASLSNHIFNSKRNNPGLLLLRPILSRKLKKKGFYDKVFKNRIGARQNPQRLYNKSISKKSPIINSLRPKFLKNKTPLGSFHGRVGQTTRLNKFFFRSNTLFGEDLSLTRLSLNSLPSFGVSQLSNNIKGQIYQSWTNYRFKLLSNKQHVRIAKRLRSRVIKSKVHYKERSIIFDPDRAREMTPRRYLREENIENLKWRVGFDNEMRLYKLRLRNEKNPKRFKVWYARTFGVEEEDFPKFKVPGGLRKKSADVFKRKPRIRPMPKMQRVYYKHQKFKSLRNIRRNETKNSRFHYMKESPAFFYNKLRKFSNRKFKKLASRRLSVFFDKNPTLRLYLQGKLLKRLAKGQLIRKQQKKERRQKRMKWRFRNSFKKKPTKKKPTKPKFKPVSKEKAELIRKPLKRILKFKITRWFKESKLPTNHTLNKSLKKALKRVSSLTLNNNYLGYEQNTHDLKDHRMLDFFLKERFLKKKLVAPKFRKKNKLLKKSRKRFWRYKFKLPRRRRRRKILRKKNKLWRKYNQTKDKLPIKGFLQNFEHNEVSGLINQSQKLRFSSVRLKPTLNNRLFGVSNLRNFIRKLRALKKILYRLDKPTSKNYLSEDVNLTKQHIRNSEKILSKLVQSALIIKPLSGTSLRHGFEANLNLKRKLNAYTNLINRNTDKLLTKVLTPERVSFRKYLKGVRRYYKKIPAISDRVIKEHGETHSLEIEELGEDFLKRVLKLKSLDNLRSLLSNNTTDEIISSKSLHLKYPPIGKGLKEIWKYNWPSNKTFFRKFSNKDGCSHTPLYSLRVNSEFMKNNAQLSTFLKNNLLRKLTLKTKKYRFKRLSKTFNHKRPLNLQRVDNLPVPDNFQPKFSYFKSKSRAFKFRYENIQLYDLRYLSIFFFKNSPYINFSSSSYLSKLYDYFLSVNSARYQLNYLKSISNFDQLRWLSNFKKSQKSLASNNFFSTNRYTILEKNLINLPTSVFSEGSFDPHFNTLPVYSKLRRNVSSFKSRKALNSFLRYYNMFTVSKSLNLNPIRRPLFSMFFDFKAIHNVYFFRSYFSKKINLRWKKPVLNNSLSESVVTSAGTLNTAFMTQSGENTLETVADNNLPNYLDNLSTPFFVKSIVGSYFYSHSQSRGGAQGLAVSNNNVLSPYTFSTKKTYNSVNNYTILDTLFYGKSLDFWSLPTLFKYIFWNNSILFENSVRTHPMSSVIPGFILNNNLTFSSKLNLFKKTNLIPLPFFKYSVKRTVLKIMANDIYLPRTTMFFYRTLIHFIEFHTGRRVLLKFDSYITTALPFVDVCRCSLWYSKVNSFQKMLGHRIFVHESIRIIMVAVRFRDPTFFSNWIKAMLYRMSFWKYRLIFRYIRYVFRALFFPQFEALGFKGMKIVLRGKISVAGNARTRTLVFTIGNTSHAEMNNRILSSFTNIHSFTGVMGFRLSFFF